MKTETFFKVLLGFAAGVFFGYAAFVLGIDLTGIYTAVGVAAGLLLTGLIIFFFWLLLKVENNAESRGRKAAIDEIPYCNTEYYSSGDSVTLYDNSRNLSRY